MKIYVLLSLMNYETNYIGTYATRDLAMDAAKRLGLIESIIYGSAMYEIIEDMIIYNDGQIK